MVYDKGNKGVNRAVAGQKQHPFAGLRTVKVRKETGIKKAQETVGT